MAYENFIPEIWAEEINRSLDIKCVFAEDCNRKYEGAVSKAGDTVHILGVGTPTITDTTIRTESSKTRTSIELEAPEDVDDLTTAMVIRHVSYYNYKIDDIDKRQAVGGVMEALAAETSNKLASKVDANIAAQAQYAAKLYTSAKALTKTNVLGEIDRALEALYINDVDPNSGIVVTLSPQVYTLFRQAYQTIDTNNSNYLKHGFITMYNNAKIKMSNNVYKSADATPVHHIMVRTPNAVAAVRPMNHVEAYRPEGGFSDAVKGFVLHEAKIVRPKEIVCMNVTV